jgi:hypothetical protein
MAWDEQRRMRDAHTDDTAKIVAAPEPAPEPPAGPAPVTSRGGSGVEAWGRRFGWMVAVGISVLALVLSGIALANSGGPDHAGFHRGGMRFGGPGFGGDDGYGYRGAPGGSGSGSSTAPSGSGQQFPAPDGFPSQ